MYLKNVLQSTPTTILKFLHSLTKLFLSVVIFKKKWTISAFRPFNCAKVLWNHVSHRLLDIKKRIVTEIIFDLRCGTRVIYTICSCITWFLENPVNKLLFCYFPLMPCTHAQIVTCLIRAWAHFRYQLKAAFKHTHAEDTNFNPHCSEGYKLF